jgi:hypothetical protein
MAKPNLSLYSQFTKRTNRLNVLCGQRNDGVSVEDTLTARVGYFHDASSYASTGSCIWAAFLFAPLSSASWRTSAQPPLEEQVALRVANM